jgi:drug/metabolite transporter (DMT)-like permease
MDSLSERRKSLLYIVITAVLWSTSGVLIKMLTWGPIAILAGRSIFSSVLFLAYLRRFPTKWTRWKITAAVAYIATQFLFITATKLTTAANAIFLQYTAPIYVIFLAFWFLHEKPSRADWASTVVIFLGMLLFFGDKLSANGIYGNILAILSGISLALMMISLRAQKDGVPAESFLIANIFSAVIGFAFILKEAWTINNWLIILFLGLVQIGLSNLLFSKAIKHVPALEANLVSTLEPVLNPVWVFLFLGESMGVSALIGGLVVLGGVVFSAVSSAHAAKESEKAAAFSDHN